MHTPPAPIPRSFGQPRRIRLIVSVVAAALTLAGSLSALALAGGGSTVASASNSKLHEQLLVNAQGRTLYELSPETASRLLCKSSACLDAWPPLTVSSNKAKLTAGPGVHGRLGLLERGSHEWQVTIGGLPLYLYAGDSASGQANGQNIHSFGGTWHVVSTSGANK
jgi:predicted lipoprotein with Yx(FWY)xxD motif